VTFLFTDIEGSTLLWETSPQAMADALERHDAIVRGAIDAHEGFVFSTGGDGVAAAFGRAADALAAATTAQAALTGEIWPEGALIRVRMGLHTGEAVERDGDYFGTTLNRAARLMAVAHGGQTVCSRAAAELVGGNFPLRALGEHRLRDLTTAEQVFQVGAGVFPPLRSVDAVPTNLPTMRTELIGRTDDIAVLTPLLEREPLVTLTGVGGVGKTRLALGVAAALAAEYADGCWIVELAPVADGAEVVKTVAAVIRSPVTDLDGLVAYLAERRMLIILDNCEHVLSETAELVDAVLADGPDVHVLVTSREPLGLDGEKVRRVQSLQLPDHEASVTEAATTPALRLFADRAAAVSDGFEITSANLASVVEICRHLDGIPLAIELAAARVRVMPPTEIAARLGERFRLLAGGSRRAQERHRTLLATVSWSYDLLSEAEKVVFRRLAVFPASFDLAAAEAIASGDDTIDILECVLHLVDRSLVQYEPEDGRYRLLETLRQYGADRLAEAGETSDTRDRHGQHFLALVDRLTPEIADSRYLAAHDVLSAELDNLRATADWCVESRRWGSLIGMTRAMYYFIIDSAAIDGARWYRQAIDHEDALDPHVVVDALGELSWINVSSLGDFPNGVALAERSDALARMAGLEESPYAWISRAMRAMYVPDPSAGAEASTRALAAAEARQMEVGAVLALAILSNCLAASDPQQSSICASETMRRAELTGQPSVIVSAILAAAGCCVGLTTGPDFSTARTVLSRAPDGYRLESLNTLWLEALRGEVLVGLDEPGAVDHLANAISLADRLSAFHIEDSSFSSLALAAARAGYGAEAAMLAGYSEQHFRPYRMFNGDGQWLMAQLENALAELPDRQVHRAAGAALARSQMMTLVTQLCRDISASERFRESNV
jgi:predicted ATPase